jgi:tRNA pseudouridine38-40 synthase
LNSNLPRDIAVRSAIRCEPGYEPRFDAVDKTYLYLLHLGVVSDPFLRHRAWHLGRMVPREFPDRSSLDGARPKLNLQAMREAAQVLVGTHDFHALRASDDGRENTVRTIFEVTLQEHHRQSPELLAIEVRGDSFLKAMVRIMVGTLVEVGRNRISPEQVRHLLEPGGMRQQGGETAPARGLTLVDVRLGRTGPKTPSAPG